MSALPFELVLGSLDAGIAVQDPSGKLVFVNERAATMTGFSSAAEMMNASTTDWAQRFSMLDEHGVVVSFDRLPGRVLLGGGTPREITVKLRLAATGEERWSRLRATAIRDEAEAIRFVVNSFEDVTLQRRKDEELRVAQEWCATALSSIGDAVVTTDREGRVTFLNPVAESLMGWSLDEMQGRALREIFRIVNQDSREPVESPVERALAEDRVVGLANHTILIRRDGAELAIEDSAAPIRDGKGEIVGVVLIFRDVTARRREENGRRFLVRATRELDSSLDYEVTLATVARLAVPQIADWCAVDVVEAGAIKRLAVAHVDPQKIDDVREIERRYPSDPNSPTGVPNVLRTGEPEMIADMPPELLRAAGTSPEHVALIEQLGLRSYIAVPLRRGTRTIGVITLVQAESKRLYGEADLALAMALADRAAIAIENARLFRELARASADAELANRSKDEFLAMLGHELRNPLAPISTALEVMAIRGGDTLTRERELIQRQVRHMVRLVDDLLDVSRITRGKIELQKGRLDMAEIVDKAIEMAGPLLTERAHELTVAVPPRLFVVGDPVRMAQVFANLLTNAAKYTERGGKIAVSGERRGNDVVLHVRDNGIGIARAMLPRVFDLFVQEMQPSDRGQGGLGLGLAIVRNLVTLHGGTVACESEGVGRGTDITVVLPALTDESAVPVPPPPAKVTPRGSRRVRLLIVDDNIDALELLTMALEMAGYDVVSATDGPSALELAAKERPAIALLDIGLPIMDGYELGRRLKATPGLEALKLVAITGYGQASDRSRSAEAGFAGHLVKPVTLAAVQSMLEKLA